MNFSILKASLNGDFFTDEMTRRLYATDASLYRELPIAVAYPKDEEDIVQLIHFANQHKIGLIPRTAGTSLAGQCVGNGIVIDTSHYFTKILHLDKEKGQVTLQPGIIRDELNRYLKPHGWFFGPNTSTANRAMIGGMVGNNSSGSYSIVYKTTREHVLEVKGYLSDGKKVHFKNIPAYIFTEKCKGENLENKIYRFLYEKLNNSEIQEEIKKEYPRKEIHRRNTGYAIDLLLDMQPFDENGMEFNLCKLLAGSEGTLMIMTEITLHLDVLPPPQEALVCVHYDSLENALRSVTTAMKHKPRAVELMDKKVLDCTKANIEQSKNRFFLQGDPAAILMVEFGADTKEEATVLAQKMIEDLQNQQFGYAYPILYPPHSHKAMELRKAGLGVLANMPGDAKAIEFVEDTAVRVEDLADYIAEFDEIMQHVYRQEPVYYAHAGAGELHIRPRINLRTKEGLAQFRGIARDSAMLVKKFGGSLSGEHGDGRVRAEFIPFMLGEKNYALLKELKYTFDPNNIFNPGKIIDAPPIDVNLKAVNVPEIDIPTMFDFSNENGILRATQKCTGSADCRKLPAAGGTMCPSYMATRNEKDTTRARANILREFLTFSDKTNRFHHQEIYDVMDLCISCKGCKSECPSNVDMATLKSEFLYQYYQANGTPFHIKAFANITALNFLGQKMTKISNFFLGNKTTSSLLKKILKIAPKRNLPLLAAQTTEQWYKKNYVSPANPQKTIYFFADEFTNFNDAEIGIKAIQLLTHLGYEVIIPHHAESGRAFISKGLLKAAKHLANRNFDLLSPYISAQNPLIGIEPSAILTFRDEFIKLVEPEKRAGAKEMAKHVFTIEEFFASEIKKGNISSKIFTKEAKKVLVHGHCHQKALSDIQATIEMLSLPEGYKVEKIPSGCCGMAGSFGYEAEHYEVSMQIGELVLFPAIRNAKEQEIVVAAGFSCRHQIADGVGEKALHPIEVLWEAVV